MQKATEAYQVLVSDKIILAFEESVKDYDEKIKASKTGQERKELSFQQIPVR